MNASDAGCLAARHTSNRPAAAACIYGKRQQQLLLLPSSEPSSAHPSAHRGIVGKAPFPPLGDSLRVDPVLFGQPVQVLLTMIARRTAAVVRRRLTAAVANGSKLLPLTDGRSATARRFRDLVEDICGDLGGAAHLSEGQRQERERHAGTSNLPFDEWTSIFGSERLTGAFMKARDRQTDSTRAYPQMRARPGRRSRIH
jgi:hypothetical protein